MKIDTVVLLVYDGKHIGSQCTKLLKIPNFKILLDQILLKTYEMISEKTNRMTDLFFIDRQIYKGAIIIVPNFTSKFKTSKNWGYNKIFWLFLTWCLFFRLSVRIHEYRTFRWRNFYETLYGFRAIIIKKSVITVQNLFDLK